jgi:hypothetical protein
MMVQEYMLHEQDGWQLTRTKHRIAHMAKCYAPANMRAAGERCRWLSRGPRRLSSWGGPACPRSCTQPAGAHGVGLHPGRSEACPPARQPRHPRIPAQPLAPTPSRYPPPHGRAAAGENPHYQELLQSWISGGYKLRYSGGMVPDVHHILAKVGGVVGGRGGGGRAGLGQGSAELLPGFLAPE